MMVTCRWVQDRLLIYLAGELDPRLAAKLVRHLETCGRCTRHAEELADARETVEGALREQPLPTVPATLDARVMNAVRALPTSSNRTTVLRVGMPVWGRFSLAGLAAGSLLGIGFFLGRETVPGNFALPGPMVPATNASVTSLPLVPLTGFGEAFQKHFPGRQSSSLATFEVTGADADAVAREVAARLSFPIQAADLRAEGGRLLGGGRATVNGVTAAEFIYERGEERIALYQIDARTARLPQLNETVFEGRCFLTGQRDGLSYALWCDGKTHFVLVSRLPAGQLLRLASAAGAATQRISG